MLKVGSLTGLRVLVHKSSKPSKDGTITDKFVKLGKVHNDMEALKDKVNSLELRSEELDYNIEQQKEQNSELASKLDAQVEDNEDMKSHKRLSD